MMEMTVLPVYEYQNMMEMTTINHDSNPNQIWIKCGVHTKQAAYEVQKLRKKKKKNFRLTTEGGPKLPKVDFCS